MFTYIHNLFIRTVKPSVVNFFFFWLLYSFVILHSTLTVVEEFSENEKELVRNHPQSLEEEKIKKEQV